MSEVNVKRKFSKSDLKTLKWMIGTFHKEKWQVAVLVFANMVNAIMTVLYADFSKRIINAATEDHSFE